MEGGPFSNCDVRRSAAHIHLNILQGLHWWTAAPFQHVVLAFAPRACVLKVHKSFFNMWLSFDA
eukprot:5030943-Pyramimonas_sp.AAC.1